MDMELNKRKIDFFDTVYETGALHEENIEIIVPDASPDMTRMISSNGYACVKDKSLREGALDVSGVVKGCVLYLADGDNTVRKLDVNIPFAHTFESPAIANDVECAVSAKLTTLEAREINSRKLAIRAHIALEVKCYRKKSHEFCCEIPQNNEYSIEILSTPISFYAPVVVMEKSFTIMDDIEISQSGEAFASMLRHDINLSCSDMKIIGNKAIVKGIATVKYTYNTKDGAVAVASHDLPYSQIMDIEGMEEDCDLTVRMTMRAAEIEPAHDMSGDTRYISVNILVDACAVAYFKEEFDAVNDLYSISHVVNAEFEEVESRVMSDHSSRRVAVTESIETACTVKRILDTTVTLEPTRCKDNKIVSDAQIQVLYIGEDDMLHCATRKCSAECMMNTPGDVEYLCDTSVSGENANGMGNEISVRFFVDYDIRTLKKVKNRNLSVLSIGDRLSKEDNEASVVIKYVYSDQPIWNIAKTYNTTIDEIAAANGLDLSETVAAGSMLLIPRKG